MAFLDLLPHNWVVPSVTVCLGYLALVRFMRWRRFDALHRKYASKMHTMTPAEAQDILLVSYLYDLPGLLNYALSFALFKTYAIPSVSELLIKTRQLTSKEHISKRYADTEILITTFMICPISGLLQPDGASPDGASPASTESQTDDARAAIALARVNWLHSHFNISNDAYLYTLSLFVLEPISWCERFGWRILSPLECQAHYVFWHYIGTHMGITDIPPDLPTMRTWSAAYERAHMLPAPVNRDVSSFTMGELLHAVPEAFGLKDAFRRLALCLLEERVRVAMMQPAQPRALRAFVHGLFRATAFWHAHASLPASKECSVIVRAMPKAASSPTPAATAAAGTQEEAPLRMSPTRWQAKPWYKAHATTRLGAMLDRLAAWLGLYDDVPGPKYRSEGYRLEELGPLHWEKSGHDAVMKMAEQIHGCPFGGPFALKKGTQKQ